MEREEVIQNLRACLLCAKGGVRMEELSRDYKTLIDDNIPFRKLGYSSLFAFLRTVSGIRTYERGGDCYIEAVPTAESAHLAKLVAQQKSVSKKSKKKVNAGRRPTLYNQSTNMQRNSACARSASYHSSSGNNYSSSHGAGRQNVPAPLMTTKFTIQNNYSSSQGTGRQNAPAPLMSTKFTVQNSVAPQYTQSNSGTPPSPPSKRLKDKQANVLSMNQSNNKPKEDPHLQSNGKVVPPLMSQILKTVNNNTELPSKGKSMNISERLVVNPTPLAQLRTPNNISTPISQAKVLSPLSPAQALAGGILQYQHSPSVHPPVPLANVQKPVPKPQRSTTPDPISVLQARANELNLPDPVYQIFSMKSDNSKGPTHIYSRVKVGPHGYTSYPQEARSETEAQILVAKIALAEFSEKYGSPTNFPETTNPNLIRERILSIVDTHPNGIFMHQVPIYYKQQYKEILPGCWERIIEECRAIILEKGADHSIILRRFISSPDKMSEITSPKSDKIQLNPIGPPTPGVLELPENDTWWVVVTYVMSTIEVWVRLGDEYSEQFNILTAEMMQYYSQVQQPVKAQAVEQDTYYAVFVDESWHRVRCVDYDSATGLVSVLFIDYGDEDAFHYDKLYPLDRRFTALPAQALRLCLSGLEDFSDCESAMTYTQNTLLDGVFFVEVISRDSDEEGPFASVVFYDTSGSDDVNLNAQLSKQIVEHILLAPKLGVKERLSEVFVSHVDQNGDTFVQVQSESMKLLVNLLNRLIGAGLSPDDLSSSIVTTIDTRKTYFVSVEDNWFRGKVVESSLHGHVKVYLIDFGKTVTTKIQNLLSLEKLSDILPIYPPQAIKVHLHNIDSSMFNDKMVAKFAELAPKDEPLLVKVVSSKTSVPVVELFKRIQPSNMLVSINNTLALEEELIRSQGDGNNNIKPRKRLERMNSKLSGNDEEEGLKHLKPPKISGIGEFFDVHVTMAAHPGNFTVQPFDDKSSLERMMAQLQETCAAYTGPPPTPESVREGKVYAAEHNDGNWYRVCISSIIREQMASVYFCDYGDVSVLPLSKLQPLKSQFLELPYQAIKAKLAGVKPINVDWSVEDSIRFQELVVEKNFVSVVVESNPAGGLSPADTILSLKLIDVTTHEDIYIDQVLVQEGRAQNVH